MVQGVEVQKPWLKQSQGNGWSNGEAWGGKGGAWGGKGGAWGAKGGAWGGKGGAWSNGEPKARQAPTPIPDSFVVDPNARFPGKCCMYKKWSGFGFVELNQKGLVPEDKVYVNWQNLHSEDRFPSLNQDQDVEFSLAKVQEKRHGGVMTLQAVNVTLPGGAIIALQDAADAEKKEFVGGQNLRYTGKLKFYNPQGPDGGYGYVDLDEGYLLPEGVPKSLRVEQSEVNAGGQTPVRMDDISVEFGIWKTTKGSFKAYNMTLPGGLPMVKESLDNRQVAAGQTFQGTVDMFNWQKGWGFIAVSEGMVFPPAIEEKIQQMNQATIARGKPVSVAKALYFSKADIRQGVTVDQGQAVTFQVYTDSKGAGASDVF